jgi:hypothetical protein
MKERPARTLLVGIFLVVGIVHASSARHQMPTIVGTGPSERLVMPSAMVDAIRKVAPGFVPWQMKDYLPRVRQTFRGSGALAAPFAVISDINRDGVQDLVVDGHAKDQYVTVAVLSSGNGFAAQIIDQGPLLLPADNRDVGEDGKISTGLNRFLSFSGDLKSRDRSYAFEVNYAQIQTPDGSLTDVAVEEYYYRKGKFRSKEIGG